jgi:enolase
MKWSISRVRGRQIWDSRGRPTVEAEVSLAGSAIGRACAPAGASRGVHEALERRDGGARFGGYGVDAAVAAVSTELSSLLCGRDVREQAALDALMIGKDATPNLGRLGANAIVAVSLALLDAAANAEGQPRWAWLAQGRAVRLPLPEVQIFGGGAHAGRRTDVQDFMVMTPRAGSVRRALELAADIYRCAGEIMAAQDRLAGCADEGGWWPMFDTNEAALDTLVQAIERAGCRPGEDAFISLDIAANELTRNGGYRLGLDRADYTSEAMVEHVAGWVRRYPILSVEDPVAQDDFAGMASVTRLLGQRVQLIGDDILVTNAGRVRAAAEAGAGNALLVKVNQAGTVTGAKAALDTAHEFGWGSIVSARSGETEDVSIAHLAVGWDAGQLKVGSFARSERMAKWNELLRIEEAMGADAHFAGPSAFAASVAEALG